MESGHMSSCSRIIEVDLGATSVFCSCKITSSMSSGLSSMSSKRLGRSSMGSKDRLILQGVRCPFLIQNYRHPCLLLLRLLFLFLVPFLCRCGCFTCLPFLFVFRFLAFLLGSLALLSATFVVTVPRPVTLLSTVVAVSLSLRIRTSLLTLFGVIGVEGRIFVLLFAPRF